MWLRFAPDNLATSVDVTVGFVAKGQSQASSGAHVIPQRLCDLLGMHTVLELPNRADAQLLKSLVVQPATVVIAHARTRPPPQSYERRGS